jgi:hypothetical protein
MPKQNRMTPLGEIVAVPERGTMMGNRGRLHDKECHIRRPWQVKRWLICLLDFNGRHRQVMAPDRYTELFFLDEATGLAAGHRPCFECRRKSYNAFVDAWTVGNSGKLGARRPTADSIDERLHGERVGPGRSKHTFTAQIGELPDGVFVTLEQGSDQPLLLWDGRILVWSPGGYKRARPRPDGVVVSVPTPGSTVAAIRAGYFPEVHPMIVTPGGCGTVS